MAPSSPIPIQNLYYLFLYAWDRFPEGQAIEVAATDSPDLVDLFAKVLSNGVRRLLRRGLDRHYLELEEETASPRGRFLLSETFKRSTLIRGRAVCAFDELSADIPHNQVLKATLRTLAAREGLDPKQAQALRTLHRQMAGVSDRPLTRALFQRVQLGRNNRHYDLLLRICSLILDSLLPGEGAGRTRFADILEDEAKMSTVFEAFVRNFYRSEQTAFQVGADHLTWDANSEDPNHARFLPAMRTDVTLRSPERTIVLDAKFYKTTLAQYRGGTDKVRSGHLYQLLTYLRHIHPRGQPAEQVEGILLYPRTSTQDLRLDYRIAGHRVRIHTLALDRPWQEIEQCLLNMVSRV
ncbi:5-methylcytosine-specific restriction endonuclease system specificity protein McrC [Roseomonas haemaphysalidis]|uniref:5-methylcytosine-specific restriction endonuclease system specificity protein McrC n=1 Tax=Roseomonas haemaphysalidis TaxID=2768162 RepID=A0ABS3KYL2_9PROT|nr:5-methylcytosine-specific restriction endonuclease system specificity protein McrC [Roseomonas haemaphysalidis]MBO1081723.1 5-methylcytosine-specific restriction endonuclease system specificity protein McrC [Roseomonas haemaphysalidis]